MFHGISLGRESLEEATNLLPRDLDPSLKLCENSYTSSAVEDSVTRHITKQGRKEGHGLGYPNLRMAELRVSLCLNVTDVPSHNTAGIGITPLNFCVL